MGSHLGHIKKIPSKFTLKEPSVLGIKVTHKARPKSQEQPMSEAPEPQILRIIAPHMRSLVGPNKFPESPPFKVFSLYKQA
jgi:hypothetical protein